MNLWTSHPLMGKAMRATGCQRSRNHSPIHGPNIQPSRFNEQPLTGFDFDVRPQFERPPQQRNIIRVLVIGQANNSRMAVA